MSTTDTDRVAALDEGDYRAIESAVMETDRGRWFLAEYTRRNRAADTASILEALTKLEQIAEPLEKATGDPGQDSIRRILADARAATWQGGDSRNRPPHQRPEQAAVGSIAAARRTGEKIREVAYELREAGGSDMYADALDLYCHDLASAMDLQEDATRRLAELAALLVSIEATLEGMPADEGPDGAKADSVPADDESGRDAETTEPGEHSASAPKMQSEAEPVSHAPPTQPEPSAERQPGSAPTLMFVNPN